VNSVSVVYIDDQGEPVRGPGSIPQDVIKRELSVKVPPLQLS